MLHSMLYCIMMHCQYDSTIYVTYILCYHTVYIGYDVCMICSVVLYIILYYYTLSIVYIMLIHVYVT